MAETLKITIEDLPLATQSAIISAAEYWKVTPSEAVRRILNLFIERIEAKSQPA